jgi:hypothetical protein
MCQGGAGEALVVSGQGFDLTPMPRFAVEQIAEDEGLTTLQKKVLLVSQSNTPTSPPLSVIGPRLDRH